MNRGRLGGLPPAPARGDAPNPLLVREAIRLRGVVQGIGFRPFVFGLAERHGLAGFVRNDGECVTIEVEGAAGAIEAFGVGLIAEAPPLARIVAFERASRAPCGESGFVIRASAGQGAAAAAIPADLAPCPDCLAELFDPRSRFHLYPFLSCTRCGPRASIVRALPYDRANTALADFPLCPACAAAYRDPRDRRFHAETIACPVCGPRLDTPLAEIVAALRAGRIVALKGVGGFHLLCDATNPAALAALRARKGRDAKPFAVMVANEASLDRFARPEAGHRAAAAGPARPIVLMPGRARALAAGVAPGLAQIGLMLPPSALHEVLFHALAGAPDGIDWRTQPLPVALVATSANPSGEPLVIDDAEARARLGGIADLIVGHDRAIVTRLDDSLLMLADGAPAVLRRGRGLVPEPLDLGGDGPCVLALGAHLKATVTLTRGREAFVSQHVGDLDSPAADAFLREVAAGLTGLLGLTPDLVVCDRHPDYRSTRIAEEIAAALGRPVLRVQHHAAHIAAIAAEHRIDEPLLGAALDGIGLGDDGTAWGGELLRIEAGAWQRLGALAPLALPGGDRAAREPWRMATAALARLGRADAAAARFPTQPLAAALAARIDRAPVTTSLGRLFDAAAALLGLRLVQDHEAQAAMELEALVTTPRPLPDGFTLTAGQLDFLPLLATLATPGLTPTEGADLFHGTLIAGLAAWIAAAATEFGTDRVALGGGCLANRVLADGLAAALRRQGLTPLLARAVPCGDGGLSLGQAALARKF
ncbi:carbamoyltransferase HypF [Phaeospirillum tilakii]|uniref:Carbamoyltransferase HypF n=1 Tax=Phaeospirillum tilakii TaxID=741673 RepID=A0ABW5C6B0_9PROT